MHGHGTFTYASGVKYVGEWKDNKQHGQGTYTLADGVIYVGQFKDGNPVGGWHYWKDGEKTWSYKDSNGKWVHKDSKPE